MTYAFLAVSAVVPSLLLIWYFHSRDVYPEPKSVVLATFGLSVLSVIPVLITALPIKFLFVDDVMNPWAGGAADAFLTAAIPEEFFKFMVVYFYAARHKAFDEPMDGIVYGVVGSLGFATLENVLYSMQGGMTVAIMRAVTAVPGHAFLGAIMGFYIGQHRYPPSGKKKGYLFKALFWPMVLHGLYDFPLLTVGRIKKADYYEGDTLGVIVFALLGSAVLVLIVEWIWAIKLTRRLRRDQKAQLAAEKQALADGILPEPAHAPLAPAVSTAAGSQPAAQTEASAQVALAASAPGSWKTTKGSPLAPLLMALGVILASFGGIVVLGFVVAGVSGDLKESLANSLLVVGVVGVLPLFLGLWAYLAGLRRLPKKVTAGAKTSPS